VSASSERGEKKRKEKKKRKDAKRKREKEDGRRRAKAVIGSTEKVLERFHCGNLVFACARELREKRLFAASCSRLCASIKALPNSVSSVGKDPVIREKSSRVKRRVTGGLVRFCPASFSGFSA